jgi:NAD(P)-dependent dehydrogenase (short-subunit alcohol dehydrogenase family)
VRRFEGKTALVTGAGAGIGAATARQLASEGAALVLVDRGREPLEEITAECRGLGCPEAVPYEVDHVDRNAVERCVDGAWLRRGRVDVLFANAGYGKLAPFLSVSVTDWLRHVNVNLNGTFHVAQTVAARMAGDRGGGAIVINASSGAVTYADQLSAYCATKAAVRMLGIAMASELGVHRIRVNVVMPGVVETRMTAPMLADDRHRDVLLAETPVGRLGRPEDVASLVCFLASDEAGYVTGACVAVDGGQTIHGHPRWFRLDYRAAHEERWEIGR